MPNEYIQLRDIESYFNRGCANTRFRNGEVLFHDGHPFDWRYLLTYFDIANLYL
ncbi:hypothetical protein C4K35_4157 [Pseudomonas chlororaphis subsp. piscium]|nr:hypothetical protein C4K35_4157 [Pseudomonas chlororaphis subsp. piscium]